VGTKFSRWRPPNNRRHFVLWNMQRQRLLSQFNATFGDSLRSIRQTRTPLTVITDVVFAYSTAQNPFCCLVGAILKILCPQERRVFQSKLGVSSSNQCNLHHSPHTGHLEKKIKKGYNLFRTRCMTHTLGQCRHKCSVRRTHARRLWQQQHRNADSKGARFESRSDYCLFSYVINGSRTVALSSFHSLYQ
jgi:hypothetical protein